MRNRKGEMDIKTPLCSMFLVMFLITLVFYKDYSLNVVIIHFFKLNLYIALIILALIFIPLVIIELYNSFENYKYHSFCKCKDDKLIKKWDKLSKNMKINYILEYPNKLEKLKISKDLLKIAIKEKPEIILDIKSEYKNELVKFALIKKPSLINKIENPTKDMKLIVLENYGYEYIDNIEDLNLNYRELLKSNEGFLKYINLEKEELIEYLKIKPYGITYVNVKDYFSSLEEIEETFKPINIKKYLLKKQLELFNENK